MTGLSLSCAPQPLTPARQRTFPVFGWCRAWLTGAALLCAAPAAAPAKHLPAVAETVLDEIPVELFLPPGQVALNGSLTRYHGQLVLAFRLDRRDRLGRPWMQVGVVDLDERLQAAGPVSLFDARTDHRLNPTAEDPRLLCHDDRLFVVYNSTMDGNVLRTRRQVHLAELAPSGRPGQRHYAVVRNKELTIAGGCTTEVEKNWTPFSYAGELHFAYTTNPPRVLKLTENAWQRGGDVVALEQVSELTGRVPSPFGEMRGGTPAIYDAELDAYVAFHHTRLELQDSGHAVSYFAGMYTFEPRPPFAIRQQLLNPIVPRGVYHDAEKKVAVTYPGGYVRDGDRVTLLVGENDRRLNAVVLNYPQLVAALRAP